MVVAGVTWPTPPGGKVLVPPNPGLEAHVDLANVVQGGEQGQPRRRGIVQGVQTPGTGQPLPDGWLGQQSLEAGAHIGQVVLQQVDALRPPLPVRPSLGPELTGIDWRVLIRGHVCSSWGVFGSDVTRPALAFISGSGRYLTA